MRKSSLFLLLIFCKSVIAQNESINIEKLRAPASPASNIIGIQPSDISRPKSVKELETALYNNFVSENEIVVPNDYSLEIMPYWILNQTNVDERNYLIQDKFNAIYSNLSVSVASTQNYILYDSIKSNAMGFGARTILYKSPLNKEKQKLLKTIYLNRLHSLINIGIQSCLDKYSDDFSNYELVKDFIIKTISNPEIYNELRNLNDFKDTILTKKAVDFAVKHLLSIIENIRKPASKEEWEELLASKEVKTEVKKDIGSINLQNDLNDYLNNREGLQVELASALSLNFPTNSMDYSIVPRWGFWLTFSYQKKEESLFQYLIMTRYLRNDLEFYKLYEINDSINYSNSFDIGGKLLLFPSKDFTTELEIIGRYNRSEVITSIEANRTSKDIYKDYTFKWVLNLNYQIKDNMLITYSIGKDFNPIININGNLISTLGLNIGFGNPKINQD